MRIPKSIRDNLRFLTAEVGSQVSNLQTFFETFSITVAQRILDRSGYAYNLMLRIHNSCLNQIAARKESDDDTFELRLALGLARSFATSTRFILDESLARAMFLRARYLIEQILATNPKHADRFRISIKEIFIG